MGCCCSCFSNAEDIYEDNATTDKSNLLGNPVGESSRTTGYFSTSQRERLSSSDKLDEQAKLNRILHDTAKNYIDVPALNSPAEQPNYSAWEKHYGNKIREVFKHHHFDHTNKLLLTGISNVEQMLSVDPLSAADRKMVSEMSNQALVAMNGFKVNYTDSIIIPFSGYPDI